MTGESKIVRLLLISYMFELRLYIFFITLNVLLIGSQGLEGSIFDVWLQGCRWQWCHACKN